VEHWFAIQPAFLIRVSARNSKAQFVETESLNKEKTVMTKTQTTVMVAVQLVWLNKDGCALDNQVNANKVVGNHQSEYHHHHSE
jgi:hypothetical protein